MKCIGTLSPTLLLVREGSFCIGFKLKAAGGDRISSFLGRRKVGDEVPNAVRLSGMHQEYLYPFATPDNKLRSFAVDISCQ
jgi:hypothetical protein